MFGFEESYGYLTGSYVRDKDGEDGASMICERFFYKTKGISLLEKLDGEPKLKIYVSVSAKDREAAEQVEREIVEDAAKNCCIILLNGIK